MKPGYDSRSQQNKTTQDKWQKSRKDGLLSQTDVKFVAMDALENVFVGEVLTLHCHENGDCQELDDRHSERSCVASELLQSVDFSRVSSERHCCTF